MRKNATLLLFSLCLLSFYSQSQGRLERKEMKAASLENNPAGESANRMVSVYLPPGYDKSRYAVSCYLFFAWFFHI